MYRPTILSYDQFLNLGLALFLITFARSNFSLHDIKPGAVRPRLYRNTIPMYPDLTPPVRIMWLLKTV